MCGWKTCFYSDSVGRKCADRYTYRQSAAELSFPLTSERTMSVSSREVQLATSVLCSGSGSLNLLQLHRDLLQRSHLTEEDFCSMVLSCPRFLMVRGPSQDGAVRPEDCTVVAKTSLRLCARYLREECSGTGTGSGCPQLHLCKFFIYGNCRFGRGR